MGTNTTDEATDGQSSGVRGRLSETGASSQIAAGVAMKPGRLMKTQRTNPSSQAIGCVTPGDEMNVQAAEISCRNLSVENMIGRCNFFAKRTHSPSRRRDEQTRGAQEGSTNEPTGLYEKNATNEPTLRRLFPRSGLTMMIPNETRNRRDRYILPWRAFGRLRPWAEAVSQLLA